MRGYSPADHETVAKKAFGHRRRDSSIALSDSVEICGSKLSSTVARLWGSMLDEVVVWGYVKLAIDIQNWQQANGK